MFGTWGQSPATVGGGGGHVLVCVLQPLRPKHSRIDYVPFSVAVLDVFLRFVFWFRRMHRHRLVYDACANSTKYVHGTLFQVGYTEPLAPKWRKRGSKKVGVYLYIPPYTVVPLDTAASFVESLAFRHAFVLVGGPTGVYIHLIETPSPE